MMPLEELLYMKASISMAVAAASLAYGAWLARAALISESARPPCMPQNFLFAGVSSVPSSSRMLPVPWMRIAQLTASPAFSW
jgi:F0F1-type ATP synthase membrane subunit c/vacuolar-type H+-ATPase subunit K